MPAKYPTLVHDCYSTYFFDASMARSTGMALLTQSLLLAVAVVDLVGQRLSFAGCQLGHQGE